MKTKYRIYKRVWYYFLGIPVYYKLEFVRNGTQEMYEQMKKEKKETKKFIL